jgi:hypothetical protein
LTEPNPVFQRVKGASLILNGDYRRKIVLETPQWGIERPNQKNSKKHPLQTLKP